MSAAIRAWLKQQAGVVVALGILLGAVSAIILAFGGHVPPWVTVADAQETETKAAKIQQQTVETLNKINTEIDRFGKRLDQRDCADLNAAYEQAQIALNAKPGDVMAKMLRDNTRLQMRAIPGCIPD